MIMVEIVNTSIGYTVVVMEYNVMEYSGMYVTELMSAYIESVICL